MYDHILLPVDPDNEERWSEVLEKTLSLASRSNARLTVMSVVPALGTIVAQAAQAAPFTEGDPRSWVRSMIEVTQERLDTFVRDHIPDSQPTTTAVRSGTVYREILAVARSSRCDLIMIGSDRPDLRDYLLGPNVAMVVRHATCSVLVVRH